MASFLISQEAQHDIREIQDFIAESNPLNAVRFADRLREVIRRLAGSPYIGRRRDDLLAGLRTHPYGNYVIFYRPFEDHIEIVRVINASRDIESLF